MMNLFLIFFKGWHRSYTQIFFSDSRILATLLIAVSFIDPNIGFSGLIAVTTTQALSLWLGFDRPAISTGVYSYNSLLVGFGLGAFYDLTPELAVLLIFAAALTFLITLGCIQLLNRFSLPILSVPFLLAYWLLTLAGRQFQALDLNPHGIYMANEIRQLGGPLLLTVYEGVNTIEWPALLHIYFHSLGAIIFQHELIAGMVIAVGLLIASRIAFILSWIGFLSGWFFYSWIGANQVSELEYGYIGFNFILSAVAVGGFFYVPSFGSYLLSALIAPLNAILIAAFSAILMIYQLPLVSLPFNLTVLLILSALAWRLKYSFLIPVLYPLYSPEKNLYATLNRQMRFHHSKSPLITLPFFGEWTVTQGHQGKHTHRDHWRHAWDFEIADEEGKTYTSQGTRCEDYHCYGLPVIAPADGWVEEIIDHHPDNAIGDMDLKHNWGNSVVIRHDNGLYSQLSHLQPNTIRVVQNASIRRGDLVGYCGNSGRSPVPHLHFQLQSRPAVGSPTLNWPISYYIVRNGSQYRLHTFDLPKENECVSNIDIHPLLREAYHFIPGNQIYIQINSNKKNEHLIWEIQSDMYNRMYFYCPNSQSYAYFIHDGITFRFTEFYGNRRSFLYHFYIANYTVLLGFYPDLTIEDELALSDYPDRAWFFFHDLIAPFYQYHRFYFRQRHVRIDHPLRTNEIELQSEAIFSALGKTLSSITYRLQIRENRIAQMDMIKPNQSHVCVTFLKEI